VTPALAQYLNDLRSEIAFQAYLWNMIVNVDYGRGDVTKFPKPSEPPPPESAAAQMDSHSRLLEEMVFCRRSDSEGLSLKSVLHPKSPAASVCHRSSKRLYA
jgi:hypothetical protein